MNFRGNPIVVSVLWGFYVMRIIPDSGSRAILSKTPPRKIKGRSSFRKTAQTLS